MPNRIIHDDEELSDLSGTQKSVVQPQAQAQQQTVSAEPRRPPPPRPESQFSQASGQVQKQSGHPMSAQNQVASAMNQAMSGQNAGVVGRAPQAQMSAAPMTDQQAVEMNRQQAGQNFKRRFTNFGSILDSNRQSALNFQKGIQDKLKGIEGQFQMGGELGKYQDSLASGGSGIDQLGTSVAGFGDSTAAGAEDRLAQSALEAERLAGPGGVESELLKQGANLGNVGYLSALAGQDAGQLKDRQSGKYQGFMDLLGQTKRRGEDLNRQRMSELDAANAEERARQERNAREEAGRSLKDTEDRLYAAQLSSGPNRQADVIGSQLGSLNDDNPQAYGVRSSGMDPKEAERIWKGLSAKDKSEIIAAANKETSGNYMNSDYWAWVAYELQRRSGTQPTKSSAGGLKSESTKGKK